MSSSPSLHQRNVRALLGRALRDPTALTEMSDADLDLTIRIARRVRLLGRLAADLQECGAFDELPQIAKDQMQSALVLAESRARLACWELDRIDWVLSDSLDTDLIAMKGCTYLLLDLPNTRGRIFADVDLMLPEAELEEVEARLNEHGWRTQELTPYDENYYRKWTHELPPLVHVEREVEIDLHHNILPRTARLKPDAKKLLAAAKPVAGSPFRVLCDEDIVLHAMVHLMFSDDMADKLRDMVDIDELLQTFSRQDAAFWQRLVARGEELDLRRPAYYGLRYAQKLLDCPLPESVLNATSGWAPPQPVVWLMDRLVPRALFPPHPDYPSRLSAFCRLLLFVRSHWIRMPPWLLAYHLSIKFYRTRLRRG
ncbi:MAG: nucleotidyltransferase family protein [Proteobacteria bacterium]|nr:nucleotidyltransferase family protein [Pseudomonadota bacterium]